MAERGVRRQACACAGRHAPAVGGMAQAEVASWRRTVLAAQEAPALRRLSRDVGVLLHRLHQKAGTDERVRAALASHPLIVHLNCRADERRARRADDDERLEVTVLGMLQHRGQLIASVQRAQAREQLHVVVSVDAAGVPQLHEPAKVGEVLAVVVGDVLGQASRARAQARRGVLSPVPIERRVAHKGQLAGLAQARRVRVVNRARARVQRNRVLHVRQQNRVLVTQSRRGRGEQVERPVEQHRHFRLLRAGARGGRPTSVAGQQSAG